MKSIWHQNRPLLFLLSGLCLFLPAVARAGWSLESDIPVIDKLRSLRGYAADRVYAAGDYGNIIFYDGTGWTSLEKFTDKTIYGIDVYCTCEVFAAADNGRVLHYNGQEWTVEVVSDSRLRGTWLSSGSNVYAVGESGTLLHFDGLVWREESIPTDLTLQAVWGFHSGDVYAVGGPSGTDGTGQGVMIHYDSFSWSVVTEGVYPRFKSIWGSPSGKVYVVGDQGLILQYDPVEDSFSEFYSNNAEGLRDIWGTSDDNILAVGDYGAILRYDGTGWSAMDSGTSEDLFGVWAASVDLAFAAGSNGAVVRYDRDDDADNGTTGCPFVLAAESPEDLTWLRKLRDRRLGCEPSQVDMAGLFYRHAPEVSRLLEAEPVLRLRLQALITANRSVVRALATSAGAGVSRQAVERVTDFLETIRARGSRQLQQDLSKVLEGIREGGLLRRVGIRTIY